MNPVVSIIVPVYNTEEYLETCLDSLISQTYTEIEIILVNDGSTDSSNVICNHYKQIDHRIIIINQDNSGVSVARNNGIEKATGEWIMFVDSDDWLDTNAVETAVSQTYKYDVELIITTFHTNYDSTEFKTEVLYDVTHLRRDFLYRCRTNEVKYSPKEMHYNLRLTSQCAKLYRKSVLEKHNIRFPVGIKDNEDGFFNFAYVSKIKNAVYYDFPIYHVRVRNDSASRNLNNKIDNILKSVDYFETIIIEHGMKCEMQQYIYIDSIEKAVSIITTYFKIKKMKKNSFWKIYQECKNTLSMNKFTEAACNLSINSVATVKGKITVLCLKKKLYLLLSIIFNLKYGV